MKALPYIATLLLLFAADEIRAAEPSLDVYLKTKDAVAGELALKLINPTDKTFYVFGGSIGSIPIRTDVLKKGKWHAVPHFICGSNMSMRPLLPHSYILFSASDPPIEDRDVSFRIRVHFYTDPSLPSLTDLPYRKTWFDAVSPTFSSNDTRDAGEYDHDHPGLPGIEPAKIYTDPVEKAPGVPGIPAK